VAILSNLFNSPTPSVKAAGACAIGSSEAIMLAGLAFKKK
jgi:glutamate/tyrosine decarboxylase-like PLP-dependent enzyme